MLKSRMLMLLGCTRTLVHHEPAAHADMAPAIQRSPLLRPTAVRAAYGVARPVGSPTLAARYEGPRLSSFSPPARVAAGPRISTPGPRTDCHSNRSEGRSRQTGCN